MNAIKAIWTNGHIVPAEPVDWPEGSELRVEPINPRERIGLSNDEWHDDLESITAWIEAVDKIEPLIWSEGEEEEYRRYREKCRQFNIEAVRQQMQAMSGDEAP